MKNRKEFKHLFNTYRQGFGDDNSPLWEPERYNKHRPSKWFICVRPIIDSQFWLWANKNCRGQLLCYSSDSDNQEQWWGFTHKADIVLFMLRWS